jgi:lipopolysaccharide transport system ATP-binding protein
MKPILEIQNVSKKFRIQHEKQAYLSIRDSFSSLFKPSTRSSEEFYALKDVSFNVYPGESLGIIGKNGAGKSTLLKILSKITPPTSGKIISRGRIASLLEVGTGFHAELSGRENIYLNGSILGMKHKEIDLKFDEIVDFSGVENFLDTPLKHYSSGMQLRLAFAVSAFLEPEILVIDEVLAVGDAEFQKKCIGKMEDVSKSGRTILFVSHNMSYMQEICSKAIQLSNGQVANENLTHIVVHDYLKQFKTKQNLQVNNLNDDIVTLLDYSIVNLKNQSVEDITISQKIGIKIKYEIKKDGYQVIPNIDVWSEQNEYIISSWYNNDNASNTKGVYNCTVWLNENLLNDTAYTISIGLSSVNFTPFITHGYIKDALFLEIKDDLNSKTKKYFKGNYGSIIRPDLVWSQEKTS